MLRLSAEIETEKLQFIVASLRYEAFCKFPCVSSDSCALSKRWLYIEANLHGT